MSSPIELTTLISVTRAAINKAETVTSNREICVRLTNKLRLAVQTLQDIQSNYRLKSEQQKTVNGLCKDLYDVTRRANNLFDQCQSHDIVEKITNFIRSTSINDELAQLQTELQTIITMLHLALHVAKFKVSDRGATQVIKNDP